MLGYKGALDKLHVKVVQNLLQKGADAKALTTEVGPEDCLGCSACVTPYRRLNLHLVTGGCTGYWLSQCMQSPHA